MLEMSAKSENPHFFPATHHKLTVSDSLVLRVYSNTNPQNMKIADLQKGLILSCNGIDVIGEGTGFGVPIAKYSDETVFSGSSNLHVRKQENVVEIRKEFLMDLIARDRFRNLKLENLRIRTLFDLISVLSQRNKRLARSILIVKGLFFKFGVRSSFVRSPIKGSVIVTYMLDRNRIRVKLNFSQLERKNLGKVFVLNEQGAHFFSTYSDSEGLRLVDEEIGIWDNVTAQSAKIANAQNKIGFCLKNIEGSVLRRGREVMEGSLDWIGLDYELDPKHNHFEYEIELLGDQS
jgi:hypothetical protein